MSDTKISEPTPNWCRTCGRRPNDPMAALCLDTHHRTLERLHPQPAELAEQHGVDSVDELVESWTRQAKERFEKNEFSIVAESLIICARELKAALAARQPGAQVPVVWVSAEQLKEFREGSASFGARIPARLEKAGLFDTPLYAAPPAQGIDLDGE